MCPDPSPDQVHPRGIYAETGGRELETDAQYEWERFEKSDKGRRLNPVLIWTAVIRRFESAGTLNRRVSLRRL